VSDRRAPEAPAAEKQGLSKRERQKQRRQAKVTKQRVAARRGRARKRLVAGLVAVMAVGAVGTWGWQWQQSRAERAAVLADVEEFDEDDARHLGADDYARIPPSELYDHRPSTGAPHTNNVIQTGVWEQAIDERILGHNLEHGYVVAYWSPDADSAEIEALQQAARAAIDGGDEHLVATEYMNDEPMDGDAHFAFVSWSHRVLLDTFDAEVFDAFLAEFHRDPAAPEAHAGPHQGPGQGGGIDPSAYDGDLLLPPFDEDPQLIREATG
jgi:hypothetical protein